jgi:hypothetical protein
MSDYSFLPHFITEEIYVIKEESDVLKSPTQEDTRAVTEAAEPPVKASLTEATGPQTEVKEKAHVAAPEKPAPTPEPAPVAKEPEPVYLKPLPTEGSNLKHCLILVESEADVLEADLKALLEKIMASVKRSMDDVLLVNVKDADTAQIEALLSEQNHRHLITFGSQKVTALHNTKTYELTQVGHKSYLKADALPDISTEVALKKALWASLKAMF